MAVRLNKFNIYFQQNHFKTLSFYSNYDKIITMKNIKGEVKC